MVIAEIAVRQLEPAQREQLNALAQPLMTEVSRGNSVADSSQDFSPVAATAAWFDRVRGITLRELFSRHGAPLPAPLTPYGDATTDDWHYSNIVYGEALGGDCPPPGGELVNVLPLLPEAFGSTSDASARMLVLAMLVHLVGDAHQPLHTIARSSGNCRHDRGGNTFCVAPGGGGGCETNLHQLWDRAFGLFDEQTPERFVAEAEQRARMQVKAGLPVLQPGAWQLENLSLAEQLYTIREGGLPGPEYMAWGREVAARKILLAAERLSVILGQLTDTESRKGRD